MAVDPHRTGGAPDGADGPGKLACGRDRDQVWDDAAAGALDEHERTCPYCQEAIAAYAPVRRAAAEVAVRPVRPPADLVGGVMRAVRAELRPGRAIDLPAPAGGRLSISETGATTILAAAADQVPGVAVHGCRFTDAGTPETVELTITLRGARPAPETAERLRQTVIDAASAMLGLTLTAVNIEITDIEVP